MVAAGALALAPAGEASAAFYNNYCGVLIYGGSWCGDGSDHSYDTNKGWYSGSGYVDVCERLLWANTTSLRRSAKCAPTSVFRDYGVTWDMFEAEVSHLSGNRHTIYGKGVA